MEKITNEKKRNGCLPNLGSIYLWKRKSKKEERAAANASVVPETVEDKNEDKSHETLTIEKCWMSEDVEGEKEVNGILRVKEVTNEKPEEVAEMSRDKDEDGESKIVVEEKKSLVHESNAENKNSSFLEKEVFAGEGSKEMTDENRDEVLAIDESLRVVEIRKDEKSEGLKLIVEEGSESVDFSRTQAEHDPIPTKHLAIPVPQPPKRATVPTPENFRRCRPEGMLPYSIGNACAPTTPIRNDFHKVKTFDLRGVIKSSGKGLKSIPWPRRFSVK